ncbi:enoyl-CoA hydratase domain-containing protein 3, mitochondrial [Zerene cesonia]|uniref:enoyl-CoA hydratase domain-containing protein 3, mitochondrial n=1 Tax=Zerene cesonia TaxID=33412 RepID=UPI0018E553FC|nr:enoyl-CoA hydratase domain-containing protein 3, mitochondrial [Zerene cesonia]
MMQRNIKRLLLRPIVLTRYISTQNEYLIINEENGTKEITLNHEKSKNSLSFDMMNKLIEALNHNINEPSLRAIVLSANGNVFSAGHNLKELQQSTGIDQHKLIFNKASELMTSIIKSPVPVIAKVNGFAAAAGCQLVATCDMIVCSQNSKFSTPGANFGIFCSTPGIAVGRSIPKSRAMYMLLTGEPLTAQEAYESGLVTKVVPSEKLDGEVNNIIDKIKHKSRSVIALGKEFYYKQIELNIFDAYKLGEEIMVKNINSSDGQEGIRSFIEKRKPVWNNNMQG